MLLLNLLLVLIVIGVLIWAITSYIPMDNGIKTLIKIVGVVIAVVYVLSAFGVFGAMSHVSVPMLK